MACPAPSGVVCVRREVDTNGEGVLRPHRLARCATGRAGERRPRDDAEGDRVRDLQDGTSARDVVAAQGPAGRCRLVKALGCVVVVGLLVVGGFLGLTAWLIARGDDQSDLTRRVTATAIDPRAVGTGSGSGHEFAYAYRVDGQWYGYDSYFVNDRAWSPGDPVTVCVDPDDPRRHVVSMSAPCGQEQISGNSVKEASPQEAPTS